MTHSPFDFSGGAANGGDLPAMLRHLADALSWEGGPVNADYARRSALEAIGGEQQPVSAATGDQVTEGVRLADLWLDPVAAMPSGCTAVSAWTPTDWVDATLPVWTQLCDPVAARVVAAMGESLPEEMRSAAGPLLGMMGQVGGLVFGAQLGQALGSLAGEVLGSADIGLPLSPPGQAALVPANVTTFGEGLGVDADQVRLYAALREAAHQRLFVHVPWLRAHLLAVVEDYARGITVDTSALDRALGQLDPTSLDPQALQEAIGGGLFDVAPSAAQEGALRRLETMLALVEGWVDEVVDAAATGHLPSAAALRETVRRRRAAGGPGEQAFSALVGLQLRPRRLREAATLWQALREAHGVGGRDAVWEHPDLMPDPDDLDDPTAFATRTQDEAGGDTAGVADLDEELRRLSGGGAPEDD